MRRTKRWVLAFGCATLFLLSLMTDIIKGRPEIYYHSKVGSPATWPAMVLDWILLTILVAQAFRWAAHHERGKTWLAIVLPVFVMFGNRLLLGSMLIKLWNKSVSPSVLADPDTALSLKICLAVTVAWAILVLLVRRWSFRASRLILQAGSVALIAGFLLGAIAAYDLAQAIDRRSGDRHFAPLFDRDAAAQAAHPRLIWVLMDELSYNQALGDRPPDLQMPNLDALAGQSTVFTALQPVAYFTDKVIPSLLVGQKLTDPKYSGVRDVSYYFSNDQRREFITGQATVMADAERQQWNTAVDGWYIPYCTLLRDMLQRCDWRLSETKNPMRSDAGLLSNMLAPFRQSVRVWRYPPLLMVKDEDEENVLRAGVTEIEDPQLDFIYIHIPIPHPPAMYDRHTGKVDLTFTHSYEDALAHADVVIGQLMQAAESSPRWNNTTVLINGDHSWRTTMWKQENGWTPEDERISHGAQFDDRPLVLVHAPGQDAAAKVETPMSLLVVHTIVESVLHNGKPSW